MNRHALILSLLTTVVAGCTTYAGPEEVEDSTGALVTAFYGTDRAREDVDDPDKFYNGQRGAVEYGITRVELSPGSLRSRLVQLEPMAPEPFVRSLNQALRIAESPSVFVVIHGYNRSFSQVARLTSEVSYRTGFRGVPVYWSWPSLRNPATYVEDRNNMNWTRPNLSSFLALLINDSDAESIHLVCHSMGCKALVDSILYELLPQGKEASDFGELVLMAPDIDKAIFRRDLAPKLVEAGFKVSLYTAENDKALVSSRTVNGYPRAGDSSDGPVVVEEIETIDATDVNPSILGHSYFEESAAVQADLAQLLNQNRRAAERSGLVAIDTFGKTYWKINAR